MLVNNTKMALIIKYVINSEIPEEIKENYIAMTLINIYAENIKIIKKALFKLPKEEFQLIFKLFDETTMKYRIDADVSAETIIKIFKILEKVRANELLTDEKRRENSRFNKQQRRGNNGFNKHH